MRAGMAGLPRRGAFSDFYGGPGPEGGRGWGGGSIREGALWIDLIELPHMLVGGVPKAGKSVFLRQGITSLVLRHGPESLRLALIDLKGGVEFNVFGRLPHLFCPVTSDTELCEDALLELNAEMDRRQAQFQRAGVEDIQRWNEKHP